MGENSLILIRLKRSQINEQYQLYSTAPRQGSVNRNDCQRDQSLTPFFKLQKPNQLMKMTSPLIIRKPGYKTSNCGKEIELGLQYNLLPTIV